MSFKVNPFGEIMNTTDRGTLMGNRGELKVEHGEFGGLSRWKTQSWIYCSTDEKFKPNGEDTRRYTKLFFMDKFTALAAGHRPCWDCLREKYDTFIAAWLAGNPGHDFQKTYRNRSTGKFIKNVKSAIVASRFIRKSSQIFQTVSW